MKKLNFFLDIDGTLLPHGKPKISEETFSAIRKAKEGGSRFFINTARPFWLVPEDTFPSDVFDGICSGCGTCVTLGGKVIYKQFLDDETLKHVITELDKTFTPNFSMVIECYGANYYHGTVFPWYLSPGYEYKNLGSASEIGTTLKDLNAQKLSFNKLSEDFTYEMFDSLKDDFDIMIHPTYAEMAPKGYSKGAAIKIAEKVLDIPHESTVAIGDSLNDAEMMKYAAFSVAMGNATDEVKSLCDLVTDTSENDGVAKAILKLINED